MAELQPRHHLIAEAKGKPEVGEQQLRPHFTFVVENTAAWFMEARNLVLSIRKGKHPCEMRSAVMTLGISGDR